MTIPATSTIRQLDTHRLIPSKYSEDGDSVLARIADDDDHLQAILELDHATNDRLRAENNLLPGIGTEELVFGIPYYRIVNAAFTHAHPLGSRFNGADRGAWYSAYEVETAQTEVGWRKSVELAEIDWPDESITYDDYLADFGGAFHDIRQDAQYVECLDPDSYVASQSLAAELLREGSPGLIYPSVRHSDGTCLVCFRPALVGNVRKSARYRFSWSGSEGPEIVLEGTYAQ